MATIYRRITPCKNVRKKIVSEIYQFRYRIAISLIICFLIIRSMFALERYGRVLRIKVPCVRDATSRGVLARVKFFAS